MPEKTARTMLISITKEDGDLDDKRKAESNSTSNQKSLILNYLKNRRKYETRSHP